MKGPKGHKVDYWALSSNPNNLLCTKVLRLSFARMVGNMVGDGTYAYQFLLFPKFPQSGEEM